MSFLSNPILHQLDFNSNLTSIHFIGDLHGDIQCAHHWVQRTNLINLTSTPLSWIGPSQPNEAIVFLGDYVDKGVASRSVLEFIRSLHQLFPDNILPMLGNHDLYLLLDATLDFNFSEQHPMGQMAHDFTYAFIHPEEYVTSGFSPNRKDDDDILIALHEALQWVYMRNAYSDVFFCPSHPVNNTCHENNIDLFTYIPPFVNNVELATRAKTRLEQWREEYSNGLLDSGLLHWLGQLPIIAIVGDSLVMHGGLSPEVLDHAVLYAEQTGIGIRDALDRLMNASFNGFWRKYLNLNTKEGEGTTMIRPNTITNISKGNLEVISDLVNYRGYFNNKEDEVKYILSKLNANRIVVGHTPHERSTEYYDGKLLATDSKLSRTFRAFGNLFCPVKSSLRKNDIAINKRSGCAHRQNNTCEGSISHLQRKTTSSPWPKHVKKVIALDVIEDKEL